MKVQSVCIKMTLRYKFLCIFDYSKITSITLIWCTILVMISTVSAIFFSKTGGYPYGSAVSNVRPDYTVPYSNYGYGYGYQGLSAFNTRPYYTFGKVC